MNKIQQTAYSLIQSDARFVYTLTKINKHIQSNYNNYILMSLPYIGIFAHGAEQWGRKVGLKTPQFTTKEKEYYEHIRSCHKLFEKSYNDYANLLHTKLNESNNYFYNKRSLLEMMIGYYNAGTDLCNNEFCGNTILCSTYIPINIFENDDAGYWIRNMSIVAGKIANFYLGNDLQTYNFNESIILTYEDYNFYENSPLKMNNELGFVLFSILCSINYVIEVIENLFIEEIPQKFKFAYL